MATAIPARITGQVLDVTVRRGRRRSDNEPFSITTAFVLVGLRGVVPCTIPDDGPLVSKGDFVDLLAEVSVYGTDAQFRAVALFPDDVPLLALA